jgi:4-oxalocrotonate tautomerase
MPIVNVKLIEGVFSPKEKQDLIEKVTEAVVQVGGENLRPVTWVYIEEVKQGELAIGGRPLTASDVHALQRGKAAA